MVLNFFHWLKWEITWNRRRNLKKIWLQNSCKFIWIVESRNNRLCCEVEKSLSLKYIIRIFPATLLSEVTGPCGLCCTACRAPHMQTSHRSPRVERHAGFSVYTWPEIFCLSKNQASQWHFKTEQSHSAVNQVSSLPPFPRSFADLSQLCHSRLLLF